jgi:hypothetical protein
MDIIKIQSMSNVKIKTAKPYLISGKADPLLDPAFLSFG